MRPRMPLLHAPARHCAFAGALAGAVLPFGWMMFMPNCDPGPQPLFSAALFAWLAMVAGAFAGFMVLAPVSWLLSMMRLARPPVLLALWLLPAVPEGSRPETSACAFAWGLIGWCVFQALEHRAALRKRNSGS
jgi:hypothetical protein